MDINRCRSIRMIRWLFIILIASAFATTQNITSESIPGAPEILRVFRATSRDIVILWEEPRDENGMILRYTLYIQGGGMTEKTYAADSTVHAFRNKTPYTEYTIHVSASTSVGEGPNATVSVRTDVIGASKPEGVTVINTTNSSALLTWEEPSVYYKSIDAYIVTYWIADEVWNTTRDYVEFERQKTLSDLQIDKNYNVDVIAVTINDEGNHIEGQNSDIFVFSLNKSPLEAPAILIAIVEGPRRVRLIWAPPPEESLQGVFQNYVVKYQEGMKDVTLKRSTENTTYVLTDLTPFTTYSISVAVRNTARMASNIGPYSDIQIVTTEEDLPGAPEELRVLFTSTFSDVVILWKKPRAENGIIVRYTVYVQGAGMTEKRQVNGTEHTFRNNNPYADYTIHVSASTSVGEGPNATTSVLTQVVTGGPTEQEPKVNAPTLDTIWVLAIIFVATLLVIASGILTRWRYRRSRRGQKALPVQRNFTNNSVEMSNDIKSQAQTTS